MLVDVDSVLELHRETVSRWHDQDLDNPYAGLLALVCRQHQFNFKLWHEEDIARSPDVSDAQIAAVKRAIDRFNQQRNDGIEQLDLALIEALSAKGATPAPDARLNTETPGSAIDRLSIMSLRIYHMREQAERADADADHRRKACERLTICQRQLADLAGSLAELLDDIETGRKRIQVYRQMKMYNDPTMNPYLYAAKKRVA